MNTDKGHAVTRAPQPLPPYRCSSVVPIPAAAPMPDPFDLAAGWLQEHLLLPLLYALGLMQWEDVSYGWALFAVYGAVQVAITFAVCMPLERWRPVERWPDAHAVTV